MSDTPTDALLTSVVATAFETVHGFAPREWQAQEASYILKCCCRPPTNKPQPILLVRTTSGGKSAVRDAVGVCTSGIVLTIVPLLSLAADQVQKLTKLQEKDPTFSCFNLDKVRNFRARRRLQEQLLALPPHTNKCVFLFASPQTFTNDPSWVETYHQLIAKSNVRFLAIDECHLYANFGIEFRAEFFLLRAAILDKLTQGPDHNIVVLFMTASATKGMVEDLEFLTGLVFNKPNDILWPSDIESVMRRNVGIRINFDNSPVRMLKRFIRMLDACQLKEKMIMYSNSLKRCLRLLQAVRKFMDDEAIDGDVVAVNGGLFKEQKFHNTELFVGPDLEEEVTNNNGSVDRLTFSPRVLLATAGAANAGLDCDSVRVVVRDGFPTSIQDFIQEMGRAGRWSGASSDSDLYSLIVSVHSFFSLLFRIYIVPTLQKEQEASRIALARAVARAAASSVNIETADIDSQSDPEDDLPRLDATPTANDFLRCVTIDDEALKQRQYENIRKVLQLICLHQGVCIHQKLERLLINPYSVTEPAITEATQTPRDSLFDLIDDENRCKVSCWQCRKLAFTKELDLPVVKKGLQTSLVDIFIHRSTAVEKRLLVKNVLVNTLLEYKDASGSRFNTLVFGKYRKSVAASECRCLVLKLFACGVLIPAVDGKRLYCELSRSLDGSPLVNREEALFGFQFITTQIDSN
jgi:hypothetical protein